MPAKKATKRKDLPALKRWARYRAEQTAAEKRAEEGLKNADYAQGRDRLWSVKSEIGGRRLRKGGFRTKTGAKLWLRETARAYVLSQKAKALAALPSREKTIAKAFQNLEGA